MKHDKICLIIAIFMFTFIHNLCFAIDPVVDIKANGSDGPVSIKSDDILLIQLSLDPGDYSDMESDWWLAGLYEDNLFYYDLMENEWLLSSDLPVTYSGELLPFENIEVEDNSFMISSYTYFFGIDIDMNSILDYDSFYYDSVEVEVFLAEEDVDNGEPYIVVYKPSAACIGNTLFSDTHDLQHPAIVEVNMSGEILWKYEIPEDLKEGGIIGLDVERLENDRILFNLSNSGIYEIDRAGNVVWSYSVSQNSHDTDRLSNGNTIYVFGNDDGIDDTQIREVDTDGNLVWSWSAKDYFYNDSLKDIYRQGWTHANAVTRLINGNTLISLRNFDRTVEVDAEGGPVWSFDWRTLGGEVTDPHEPEIQVDDNLLVCMQRESPYRAVEINRTTGEVVWSYANDDLRTARDCDRLSNGNTLIVAVLENGSDSDFSDDESVILEITTDGEIVWQLQLKNSYTGQDPGFFYKAERICE